MFLSDIIRKNIYVGNTLRGVCCGVGVSLKSHAVKYLLCSADPARFPETDFAVNASAVTQTAPFISLTRLRPVYPKNIARLFIDRPVYSSDGAFLGNIEDIELRDFIATRIFTDRAECYPITEVTACSDAVILRKAQPYPLGQRVPAPLLSLVTDKSDAVVTKPILRNAIKKKALIKLTLSLPPFRFSCQHND